MYSDSGMQLLIYVGYSFLAFPVICALYSPKIGQALKKQIQLIAPISCF